MYNVPAAIDCRGMNPIEGSDGWLYTAIDQRPLGPLGLALGTSAPRGGANRGHSQDRSDKRRYQTAGVAGLAPNHGEAPHSTGKRRL